MDKVSVVIPCYNQEKYVSDAINSVLNQTYTDIEIIIVNDGSTDNSAQIINKFANKYENIIFIDNKENNGVVYARNIAIERANGKYILPLDADDKIAPTYIEKTVEIFNNNPDVGVVYTDGEFFGTKTGTIPLDDFEKLDFLTVCYMVCTALYRKSDWERAGGYKSYMNNGWEDYDLWLSFLELDLKFYKIRENLFFYRQYKETSRSKITNNIREIFKSLLKNHLNLYLDNIEFIEKNFMYPQLNRRLEIQVVELQNYIKQRKNKYKTIVAVLISCLILLILLLIILLVWRYNG